MDDFVWAISIHIWKLTIPGIGSKILKFVENGTTAGSGTNYKSSYAQFAI